MVSELEAKVSQLSSPVLKKDMLQNLQNEYMSFDNTSFNSFDMKQS
jgi:hypothetical protein